MPRRVVIAGGGTGGHLFPGLSIADALRHLEPDIEIRFIGTHGRIEARVVPAQGYPFSAIWVSGFRRRFGFETLLFPLKLFVSLVQSFALMLRYRPAMVIGTGGYVCGPPVYIATLLGIPTMLQEQNSYPGVTTRLLANRVRQVHIAFEATRAYLKRDNGVYLSGNPVRSGIGTVERSDGIKRLGLSVSRKTILIVGGSQGAASINDALLASPDLLERPDVQILWLTGASELKRVEERIAEIGVGDSVHLFGFLDDMPGAFAATDLVVCRAGASTLSEILCAGLPSILVPYPYAAADHQTVNARTVAEAGAAVVIPDSEVKRRLGTEIREILAHPERRISMGIAARSLAFPTAARTIAEAAVKLMQEPHGG
jgi:UDP-N-acetylglucosamine--N-acetylmuramyl-(pentapeptide) pyrophosphoryl-undecaprenol N-acetylglucosamine transferase